MRAEVQQRCARDGQFIHAADVPRALRAELVRVRWALRLVLSERTFAWTRGGYRTHRGAAIAHIAERLSHTWGRCAS